jgi:hypothetical protein
VAARQSHLARQIEVITLTDTEIRRIVDKAATEANNMARRLGPTNKRAIKAQLAAASTAMWAGVGDAVKIGTGDAVYSALEWQTMFDERMFAHAKLPASYWRASMLATANQGAQSLLSRKENGIGLSDRIWKNDQATRAALNDTIDVGLTLGKSAAEIAKDVKQYINPLVPGGASSAAIRLGRTEVANAYHATSVRKYQETPWVEKVRWNLSGSHGRPDDCNKFAESVHHRGWGPGEYWPSEVPGKPHPNCLCYVEPVVMDLDAYAKAFKAGKYDSYIDQQMGCSRVG